MLRDIRDSNGKIKYTVWDSTEWKDKTIEEEVKAFIKAYKLKYPYEKPPEFFDTYGELFFFRYRHVLVKFNAVIDLYKLVKNIEGEDGISFHILGKNGLPEVKAIKPYLYQNNNYIHIGCEIFLDPFGSLPFELFQRWIKDHKEDMYAGWLLSEFDNVKYNDIKKEHGRDETAITPGCLVFVLMGVTNKPYAVIVFEDVKALLNRLYEICPDPYNWGIPDPRTLRPATDTEYWKQYSAWNNYNEKYGGIIGNVWNVPFSAISDLATVTMIGDIDLDLEHEKAKHKCPTQVMKCRYEYLQHVADRDGRGKHFYPDEWTRKETEYIRKLEANGAKVSKRNFISLSNDQFEELTKGITITTNGDVFDKTQLKIPSSKSLFSYEWPE